MTPEASPDRRWGDSEEACEQDHVLQAPRRRWPLVVGALVLGGIGLGLLERQWWRPRRTPPVQSEHRQEQQLPAESFSRPPATALPLPATPEEFVADAKQLADRVMSAFPDTPQAFLLGGRIYYAFGDVARAKQCWEACLKLNPEFAQGWCSRGEAAWEHGEFANAASFLQKAIQYDPQLDQKQVFLLADSLMNIGEAEQAVAVLEKAAGISPLPPFGLFLLGNAYLELKEHEKARETLEAALAVDPRSASLRYGLARAFTGLGQPEKAREHREEYARLKGLELADVARFRPELRKKDWADPRPVARESYLNAGRIYALHGDIAEAEALWLRAALLDPASPAPRQLLEMLYRNQGRREEAILISRGIAPEGR